MEAVYKESIITKMDTLIAQAADSGYEISEFILTENEMEMFTKFVPERYPGDPMQNPQEGWYRRYPDYLYGATTRGEYKGILIRVRLPHEESNNNKEETE